MKFDPMTGKPISDNAEEKQEQMRFDPMTGKPILENMNVGSQAVRFDPMTGKPIREKKRTSKGVKIACGLAAGVIVIAVAVASLIPRIAFGKNYKLIQAVANTFKQNHLAENLNAVPLLESEKYTITVNVDADKIESILTLARNMSKKELSLSGSVSAGIIDTSFAAKINDSEMLLSIPDFVDETLCYSYTEEKSGCFEELVEDSFGMDAEELDETMKGLFSAEQKESFSAAMTKASLQVMKNLNFEKADERKFTVNGKARTCSGYTLQVDEELAANVCDIYEDAIDDYMRSLNDVSDKAELGIPDSNELFDEIQDFFEDVELEVSIYLYKKQVAAIIIEEGRQEVLIEFCGGNTPWENTVVSVDGEEVLELAGSVQKDVETVSLEVQGMELVKYKYNFKDGDFELRLGEGEYVLAELEGKILHSGKRYTYEISDIPLGDLGECLLQVQIEEGAEMAKIQTEDVLDIGTMSENDWDNFMEDVQGVLYKWIW